MWVQIVFDLFYMLVTSLMIGYTSSILWAWFLLPLNLPRISPLQFSGISLLITVIFTGVRTSYSPQDIVSIQANPVEYYLSDFISFTAICAFTLILGWVFQRFNDIFYPDHHLDR
ncbi:hypothetical protein [Thiomicrorhabdus xiamenensis]|uniref:Uncharacterized protein n=1 Tax=Thiomicrorhabdus xiamenensis TaxID=2739063 RepID=A0A7D4TAK7_9GAMM|nr:hypothetical protein [Thiomicrorhabdus xiamenensis]QKI89186.1 hypothetical protein HQN79_06235 [Thiomicrorhabdus xiamenensis]